MVKFNIDKWYLLTYIETEAADIFMIIKAVQNNLLKCIHPLRSIIFYYLLRKRSLRQNIKYNYNYKIGVN